MAPSGTPDAIIQKYNKALNEMFADPEFKKRWEGIGSEIVAGSPKEFGELIVSEAGRLGALVKGLGVQLD